MTLLVVSTVRGRDIRVWVESEKNSGGRCDEKRQLAERRYDALLQH